MKRQSFLSLNPGLDPQSADLFSAEALAKYQWPEGVDQKALLQDLRIRQRLLKVYPDEQVAEVLEAEGFHSAHHIVTTGLSDFTQKVTPGLSRLSGIAKPRALCAMLFDRAERIRRASFELALAAPATNAVAEKTEGSALMNGDLQPDFQQGIPDYQRLFGPTIASDGKEGDTVFGPAAYFTDLMRVVNQYVIPPSQPGASLKYRRPDLWHIPLDGEASDVEVPYLDVVNAVMAEHLKVNYLHGADPMREMAARIYPFTVPFNPPLYAIRAALESLGTSLSDIYRLLELPALAASTDILNLSPEQLLLITGGYVASLAIAYGFHESLSNEAVVEALANQRVFLQKTGLQSKQLEALVYQNLKQAPGAYVMEDKGAQDLFTPEFSYEGFKKAITVECWVYPTDGNYTFSVVGKGSGEEFYISLVCTASDNNRLHCKCSYKTQANTHTMSSRAPIERHAWTHIAWTRDAQSGKNCLYINGRKDQEQTFSAEEVVIRQSSVGIGYIQGDSSFKGRLAEIRIWSGVRTPTEILAYMRLRLDESFAKQLLCYWPLNETPGAERTARDFGYLHQDATNERKTYINVFEAHAPLGRVAPEAADLLPGLYLNSQAPAGQYMAIRNPETSGTLTAGSTPVLTGLSVPVLRQVAVYIRLAAQTGLDFETLDWLLKTIIPGIYIDEVPPVSTAMIEALGQVVELSKKYAIPPDELSSFWHAMKTYGRGEAAPSQALWDRVFNTPPFMANNDDPDQFAYYRPVYAGNPLFTSPEICWSFKAPEGSGDQRLGNQLATALGVSAQDLYTMLQATVDASVSSITLSISRLSQFYRLSRFAKMLSLSLPDFMQLTSLAGLGLSDSKMAWTISEVLRIVEVAEWLKQVRLTVKQLSYLITPSAPDRSLQLLGQPALEKALSDMQKADLQVLITPERFINASVNATRAQAIYDQLLAAGGIDKQGVVLLDQSTLTPEWVYALLQSDPDTARPTVSDGPERCCLRFRAADPEQSTAIGKVNFHFDPFANETIQASNCFTLSAWLRPDDITPGTDVKIIGRDEGGNPNDFKLPTLRQVGGVEGAVEVCMSFGGTFYKARVPGFFKNTDEWVYLSWVNDQGSWRVYRNGVLMDFTKPMEPVPGVYKHTSSTVLYLLGNGFEGSMSAVSIWTTARSMPEIQSDMAGSFDSNATDLLAYWPITEGSGAVLHDLAGKAKGADGDLEGTYQWEGSVTLTRWVVPLAVWQTLSDAFAEQNILVIKNLAPLAGISPETMSGVCYLTSRTVDNSGIFQTAPYTPYPFYANTLLSPDVQGSRAEVRRSFLSMLQRHAATTRWFKLTGAEVGGVLLYLKGAAQHSYGLSCWSLEQVMQLSAFKAIQKLCKAPEGLLAYFGLADAADTNAPSEAQLALLAELTGWNADELQRIVRQPYFSEINFHTIPGLKKLAEVMMLELRTGMAMGTLNSLRALAEQNVLGADDQEAYWQQYRDTASAVKASLRRKSDTMSSAEPAGAMASALRGVLGDWLIWELQAGSGRLKSMEDLYEYLLIDVNVSPEVKTSRIVSGMNSLQLYVNRIINNLEPGVVNRIPEAWWSWMSTYRVWQANREVYLYPENYVDPALRKFQSPEFKTFLSAVSKTQITEEHVRQSMANYLQAVNTVASLEVVNGYVDAFRGGPLLEADAVERRSLHLIGRSRTAPFAFYTRTVLATAPTPADNSSALKSPKVYFGPWQAINLQINSGFVSTVMAFGRQFIFWVEQTEVTNTENDNLKFTAVYASVFYSCRDFEGKWIAPVRFIQEELINVFGPAVPEGTLDYYEDYLEGMRPGDPGQPATFHQARCWNEVQLQVLPASGSEEEKILVTYGGLVRCPEAMTVPPARNNIPNAIQVVSELQNKLYRAAAYAYAQKGRLTTVIDARTLGSAMETAVWRLNLEDTGIAVVDYSLCPMEDKMGLAFWVDTRTGASMPGNAYKTPQAYWPMILDQAGKKTIKSVYTDTGGQFSFAPNALSGSDYAFDALEPVYFDGTLWGSIPWEEYKDLREFTVSCWVYLSKPTSAIGDRNILSLIFPVSGTGGSCGWAISVKEGKFQFGIGLAGGISNQMTRGTAEGGKWYFLAMTVRGTNIAVTVDASTSVYSIPYTPVAVSAPELTLGKSNGHYNTYSPLLGSMANLKLWESPLTDQELLDEYTSRGMRSADEQIGRLGNSAAAFMYNIQKKAYLVLPCFESKLFSDIVLSRYDFNQRSLELRFSASPIAGPKAISMACVPVNTDTVPVLVGSLARGGLKAMLALRMQYLMEEPSSLIPGAGIRLPASDLMDFSGAFGMYFWEIFFYAPYYIAEKLRTARKFPEAEKWYQYIFDPTNQRKPLGYLPLSRQINDQFPDWAGDRSAAPTSLNSSGMQTLPFSYRAREVWTFSPEGDSVVTLADSGLLKKPACTILAWINVADYLTAGTRGTVVCASTGGSGLRLQVFADTGESWVLSWSIAHNEADAFVSSMPQDAVNSWMHVGASYDGEALQVYINGKLATNAPAHFSDYACTPECLLTIGRGTTWDSSLDGFNGSIAEVLLYDRALSPGEIQHMYTDYRQLSPNSNFWNFAPFRRMNVQSLYHILNGDAWQESFFQPARYYSASLQMAVYAYDPFDPDTLARLRVSSWQKATFMRYLDNLLSWGDALFTQDTRESLSDATMRYALAHTLLGKIPVKGVTESVRPSVNFNQIEGEYGTGKVPPFLIEMENQLSALGPDASLPQQVQSLVDAYFRIPANKQLLKYWELVTDRLYKLRQGLTIQGAPNSVPLYDAPIDASMLVAASASSGKVNVAVLASKAPAVPWYRFAYMVAQARSVTSEVIRLSNALLSTLERKDAERLSLLQADYQRVLSDLTAQIKTSQINQLQYIAAGLNANLDNALFTNATYKKRLQHPIMADEAAALTLLSGAMAEHLIGMGVKTVSVFSYLLPTIFGVANGGFNPGESLNATAHVADTAGQLLSMSAQLTSQVAQYHRRQEDWEMQLELSSNQIREVQAQIRANEFSLQAAKQELRTTVTQYAQSQEVYTVLKSKFTNEELYDWLSGQLSTVHYQMFQLAWSLAQSTQAALQYELNLTQRFLNPGLWNAGRQGLLAGEALALALQQMENAYLEGNRRRLEIRKVWSMREHNPQALLTLMQTGSCRFDLDELSYDLDFPGHYNRKIKSLSITIPAVVGPYQNIHATLVQTGNSVVVKADVDAVKYLLGLSASAPSDGALRVNWNPNQEIILSTGISDTGMFQLNLNDEQYLPFEGTGAVSSWSLRMPQASNGFSLQSVNDVLVTVDYTAEDGGSTFAAQVTALPPLSEYKGWQYLSLRQLYSTAWFDFCQHPVDQMYSLDFELLPKMYPANLDAGSVRLGNGKGEIILLPILREDSRASLPVFCMNNEAADWSSASGLMPVTDSGQDVPVPGKGNPWILTARNVPEALLSDGKIDQEKLLDIVLLIPFNGRLSW